MSSLPSQIGNYNPGAASESNAPRDTAGTQPAVQPQVIAVIDGERTVVPFDTITDEPRRLQFKQRCQQATAPVVLNAIEFFAWPDAVRVLFLQVVKELAARVRLQIGGDQEQYPNAFEAVMAALPTATGTEQQTAAKQAAIVGAALFLTQNVWPAAANAITDSLTEIGTQNVAALEVFNTIRNVAGYQSKRPGTRRAGGAFPRLLATGNEGGSRRTGVALLPR